LINSILEIEDDRFDICVTDDGSSDGAYEWLLQNESDRLHVFKNEKNYGHNNFVKCLYNADGKYALLIIDRDEIIAENIVPLLDFLACQKEELSFVSCAEGDKKQDEYRAYYHESILERYMRYPLKRHPSGDVYNVKYVSKYNPEVYYIYEETGYPEKFLMKDVITEGMSVSYELPIYRNGRRIFKDATKISMFAYNDIKKWYYYPAVQLKMYEGTLKQISSKSVLDANEKSEILSLYKKAMMIYLFQYKEFSVGNCGHCVHYGFRPRFITTVEMLYWFAKLRGLKAVLKNEPVLYKMWNGGMFMDYARCIKRSIRLDVVLLKNTIRNRISE
jgi:glycosyltransferase involved in cell wall biosynthesis